MKTTTGSIRRLALALLFAIPLAWAPIASAEDISDAELDSFAAALMDVQEIGQEWTQRMQEAESEEEVQSHREQAQAEMIEAIEDHGLTVDEYNEIAMAAQNDPELAQRIQEAVAQ